MKNDARFRNEHSMGGITSLGSLSPNGTLRMQHRTLLISYFRPLLVPCLLKVAPKSFTLRTGPWGGLPQHIIASRAPHASSTEESIEQEGARQEIEREGMERANRGCTKGEELRQNKRDAARRGVSSGSCSRVEDTMTAAAASIGKNSIVYVYTWRLVLCDRRSCASSAPLDVLKGHLQFSPSYIVLVALHGLGGPPGSSSSHSFLGPRCPLYVHIFVLHLLSFTYSFLSSVHS